MCGVVSAAAQSGPVMPYVDRGACPFEGCVYRDWKATAQVRAVDFPGPTPWTSYGRVLFTIAAGETVTAMTGVVVTNVPGKATLFRDLTVENYSRGFPQSEPASVQLKRDDTIYLLTYHGEGEYTAWVNGTLISNFYVTNFEQPNVPGAGYSSCVVKRTCDGKVLNYPQKTWWVQLRNAKGQIGWTDCPQYFDGSDALAGR
jgi:hypothetical protein